MSQSPRHPIPAQRTCSIGQIMRAISAAAIFALLLAWTLREAPAAFARASQNPIAREIAST
jgi:hypothetical protein